MSIRFKNPPGAPSVVSAQYHPAAWYAEMSARSRIGVKGYVRCYIRGHTVVYQVRNQVTYCKSLYNRQNSIMVVLKKGIGSILKNCSCREYHFLFEVSKYYYC